LSSVRVGGGLRATEGPEEIAIPQVDAAQPGAGRTRRITGALHPARSSAGADTGLVLARYDPRRIQEVVARRQGSLAPCLREEAHRSPDFSGEIPIEFAVGNDGKVVALWIDEARFKSGPLRECLLAKLRDWSFDRFPGERPIISLAFRIGAR
ncbi:MAG TPA: AgmX/PglI C-terminal domain-containing protein, partial [Anaeromyxobacteraceae bacterium]|nr:AgmX/PglI C-terminal domain-containing protein [Anaeromyxobacteraceae bacterium]